MKELFRMGSFIGKGGPPMARGETIRALIVFLAIAILGCASSPAAAWDTIHYRVLAVDPVTGTVKIQADIETRYATGNSTTMLKGLDSHGHSYEKKLPGSVTLGSVFFKDRKVAYTGSDQGYLIDIKEGRIYPRKIPSYWETERGKEQQCILPEKFKGKSVCAVLSNNLAHEHSLVFLAESSPCSSSHPVKGTFVVINNKTGIISRELPGAYQARCAEKSIIYEPRIASTEHWTLRQKEGSLEAEDALSGVVIWRYPLVLGWMTGTRGAVEIENCLLVSTKDGLCRLNRATGEVIWKCPKVLSWIDSVNRGSEGYWYIFSCTM
jgi:hypothetical protein